MSTFGFSTEEKVACDFYKLVQANLCYDVLVADEETGEVTTVKRRFGGGLDLFSIRGAFLGCVYYKVTNRIAALYCLTQYNGKASVDSGYVAAKYRRQGIGFALLQQACDKLLEMGNTTIHFIVRSGAMNRLVDKLTYPPGTICKDSVGFDDRLDDLDDFLFTADERPSESF
jgi:GNAT superfamily N-acetyltransferase